MESADLTALDILKGTYSDISKTFPLAFLLSLSTSPEIDAANYLAILNAQQPKYEIKITSQVAFQTADIKLWAGQITEEFMPKTEFVKKLLALRKRAIRDGMTLLTVDEILAEKRVLRGEIN